MKSFCRLFAISAAVACLAASSALGAGAPAWAPIAASAPTNLPPIQSEVQRVAVDAEGGNYTLTAYHTLGTGTGTISTHTTSVQFFKVNSGSFSVGQSIVGESIAPGTTITACSPSCAAPTKLTISQKTTNDDGIFGASVSAVGAGATTPPLPFDAEASQAEAALNALSTIGGEGGSVTVTGGPGDLGGSSPYLVSYGGSLANTDLAALEADSSGLTGGVAHRAKVTAALDGGPGTSTIMFYAQNVGGVPSSGTTKLRFTFPAGVTTTATPEGPIENFQPTWSCTPAGAGQSSVECTSTKVATPGFTLPLIKAPVSAGPGAQSGIVHVEVWGGGTASTEAAPVAYDMPLVVSAIAAPPGIQSFTAAPYTDDGMIDARAGAHPYSASSGILVNTIRSAKSGEIVPAGEFRDIVVDTPPGFVGNPIATPQCPESFTEEDCEPASIVATAQIPLQIGTAGAEEQALSTVQNIQAPYGFPGKFRFVTGSETVTVNVVASLRSDEDYGLEIGSYNTVQVKPVFGAFFTFWGTPASPGHDSQRCKVFVQGNPSQCGPGGDNTAFLTNPVDCSEEALRPPVATLNVNTWQNPGLFFENEVALNPVEGCDQLVFEKSTPEHPGVDFTFEPSDTKSDSPASFRTELTVPSEGLIDPDKRMTPTIKESVVTLPKGVVLNASAADGLAACSKEQIGLKGTDFPAPNHIRFTKDPQTCPDASKIGTGELKSELIDEPLHGALYLAAQGDGNPFGSLFAIYLVIEDPRHGIFIKLPGEVQVDKADGQQRIVFRDLPPLPFTYLRLSLKGGNRSPLASPTTCGNFVTTATNTPWSAPESGPPATSANGFEINQGPNGGACAPTSEARPFDLGLTAGTDSPTAGAHTPLTFRITRPDGSQELNTLDLGTAPGLTATLKDIPQCTVSNASIDAKTGKREEASPSCPAASQIGRTLTGAGSGPTPFYSAGKLYLAGPYKGAPLSVLAITPAVAGPFDLGNVVVRTALFVDRKSAVVTAKTDPIPQILEGVPLRIKDVRVILDRDNFSLNPTSCDASAITVHATGNSGASKDLSSRFQVGGCGNLAFGPKLSANLKGGTKRGDHPAFSATVDFPARQANTKDVQVTLPHSEFLEQSHINTICTRVQAAANACPAGSIYGYAEAETPLLDGKLSGPVFLKSSDHQLPDLAITLRGPDSQPIEVEFAGRIDAIKAQIRNTIEGLPDVPVSKFVLRMKGGNKGLLVNSRNLCKGKVTRMTVRMVGHNNKRSESRPPLTRTCKGKTGKRSKRASRSAQKIAH